MSTFKLGDKVETFSQGIGTIVKMNVPVVAGANGWYLIELEKKSPLSWDNKNKSAMKFYENLGFDFKDNKFYCVNGYNMIEKLA